MSSRIERASIADFRWKCVGRVVTVIAPLENIAWTKTHPFTSQVVSSIEEPSGKCKDFHHRSPARYLPDGFNHRRGVRQDMMCFPIFKLPVTSSMVSTMEGPLGGKFISAVCTSVRLAGTGSGWTNHLSCGMILGYVSLEPILCGLFRETITNQSG
jgi:hypothetical protein